MSDSLVDAAMAHPQTREDYRPVSLCQQGMYTGAEVWDRQTLQLQETVLGKDHPDTLGSMMVTSASSDAILIGADVPSARQQAD